MFTNIREYYFKKVKKINPEDINDLLPAELKLDRDFVFSLIEENCCYLQYAAKKFKNDAEIVEEAVRQYTPLFQFASQKLKSDRDFCIKLIETYGSSSDIVHYSSKKLKSDKDFAKVAINKNPYTLEYFDLNLRNDYDLVLEAIKIKSDSFDCASLKIVKALRHESNKVEALLAIRDKEILENEWLQALSKTRKKIKI